MENTQFKYEGRIHANPNKHSVKFIGTVYANSISDLKTKAREHATSWNEHGGRLHIECQNTGREFYINS
jgi:hypothetical protein